MKWICERKKKWRMVTVLDGIDYFFNWLETVDFGMNYRLVRIGNAFLVLRFFEGCNRQVLVGAAHYLHISIIKDATLSIIALTFNYLTHLRKTSWDTQFSQIQLDDLLKGQKPKKLSNSNQVRLLLNHYNIAVLLNTQINLFVYLSSTWKALWGDRR